MILGIIHKFPYLFGINPVFQKTCFLVFRTFRELRDFKKGKAKEHGSEFTRRTQWAENEDQKPNMMEIRGSHAAYCTWPCGPTSFPPRGSDAVHFCLCGFVLT